jgi:hypothetical protein
MLALIVQVLHMRADTTNGAQTMKIKPEHYEVLRDAFASIKDCIASHREAVIAGGKAKDVEKRVRWDALYALGRTNYLPDRFTSSVLYDYMNDDHIDTALRAVIRELQA